MPGLELAVGLTAIATKRLVAELIRGTSMTRGDWGDVAGEIVATLITTSHRQESGQQRLAEKIDQVGKQIDAIPAREFDQHMSAGRRHLRDLPTGWRTDQDRHDLIRDARAEFVRALAVAESVNDPLRQAFAEVAISGCWLWVPSLPDVKNTIAQARRILERELLFGPTRPATAYTDVLALCKSYGERPSITAVAVVPPSQSFTYGRLRLRVNAVEGQWVECAGVQLLVHEPPESKVHAEQYYGPPQARPPVVGPPTYKTVNITVRNTRAEWIRVSGDNWAAEWKGAVIVELLTQSGPSPGENRIKPGTEANYALYERVGVYRDEPDPPGTFGFVLPRMLPRSAW